MADALDEEAPWTWRRDDVLGLLSDRQRRYVDLLPRVFQVKTASGRVVPYDMQPFQVWWHAHAPLAMGTAAPSRLAEKGRNLGLTLMAAMDALLLAHRTDRLTIPCAGRAGDTSDEFISKAWDLIRDAHEPDFFDPRTDVVNRIELGNQSRLIPLPGGSPDKSRSKRLVHGVLDEFAFHEYPDRLMKAIRGSQMEGGTLDVISTHNGSDTRFYDLVDRSKTGRAPFKHFWFPIHDPRAWRQDVPMSEQVGKTLSLIAPWISTRALEEFRLEDPAGYAQEMLCEVMDAALNLVSREEASAAMTPGLPDWGRPLTAADDEALFLKLRTAITIPHRPDGNLDPLYLAVDFASAKDGDLAAFTAFQPDGATLDQRWLEVLRGVPTPTQNRLLRLIERTVRPTAVFIDMTGGGTGLFEHARQDLKCPVYGIHFASKVQYVGATGKVAIKKAMGLNLARRYSERTIRVFRDHAHAELQRRHVQSVRRADLDADRSAEGHGDILWAQAMAAWGALTMGEEPRKTDEPTDLSEYL